MRDYEIPVYIFTGFLEAGKTTFIQESLESDEFNPKSEKTLLLCCEEGEMEYEPDKFANNNVHIEVIEKQEDFEKSFLTELADKYRPDKVIIEYNGMWMLDMLYENLPDDWMLAQEMMLAYSPNFMTYNQNMRSLVYDKLMGTEMVVFNRFSKLYDKMSFHNVVRAANRNCQIIYEYDRNEFEVDDIEDPLPFDDEADEINISDKDYAYWYRDINENPVKYDDKTVSFKGRVLVGGGLPQDSFVMGRHIMTCCIEDIQFGGLICKWESDEIQSLNHGDWYEVKVRIKNEYHDAYKEEGPVMYVEDLKKCEPLEDDVATF